MQSFNRLLSFDGDTLVQGARFVTAAEDRLRGDVKRMGARTTPSATLSRGLDRRLASRRGFGFSSTPLTRASFDPRQRAVVKLHFFGHGGGGGAALSAHARYLTREASDRSVGVENPHAGEGPRAPGRGHAAYLDRGQADAFYDALREGVDGGARLNVWAREDRRHFRIILSAEMGAQLGDLKSYTRAVMEQAETALNTRLEWVAVDHWDTDNPHTHIVLRGRRANGAPLILPRPFVKAGFREIARNEASARLGPRTPEQERIALQRLARAHRWTRLDDVIARTASAGVLRLHDSRHPSPDIASALKTRVMELSRLGLAQRRGRTIFIADDLRQRLDALELHIDIRKNLMRSRQAERAKQPLMRTPLARDR